MIHQLKNYCVRYVRLKDAEFDLLYTKLDERVYKKREFILHQDGICNFQFFIVEGLTRSFIIEENGNERITQFGIENWWITDIESYVNERPSSMVIQALEDTRILYISKRNLEELCDKIPRINTLFRKIAEYRLIAQQRNNNLYMKMNSRERYKSLVSLTSNFVQRVPQYMIASYLDITPEYLSEIRKLRS